MLDVVPDAATMARLLEAAGDIVWISNRMEAVEALYADSDIGEKLRALKGERAADRALCELTWDSYFGWMNARPKFVDLAGRSIMGDADSPNYLERAVPFSLGLASELPDPFDDGPFEDLYKKVLCLRRVPELEEEIVQGYIAKGRAIIGEGGPR